MLAKRKELIAKANAMGLEAVDAEKQKSRDTKAQLDKTILELEATRALPQDWAPMCTPNLLPYVPPTCSHVHPQLPPICIPNLQIALL